MILPSFPRLSETFIVSKFLGLLDSGHDMYIVCSKFSEPDWQRFTDLHNRDDLRSRIYENWRVLPHYWVFLYWPFAFLQTLLSRPIPLFQYLQRGWQRFGADIFRRFYLDAQIIRANPDILHFEFGALAPDRMYLRDLLDCKIVVSFRGYDINYVGLEHENHYREVWERADYLHLLGNDLWRRAQRRGCPPDKPHMLISPAINIDLFQTDRQHEQKPTFTIISVGRLEWKKGYEYAISAIRAVVDAGYSIQYRIVGDGSYIEPLAFQRHKMDLHDVVEFVGAIPHEQVQSELSNADLFLHAAVSEGFCNAVMEAQAMQLPVVTSDADGLAENVADGVTGFVVPRRDPQALAEKMMLLLDDANLRQQMGEAGRERVATRFTLDEHIDQFAQLYKAVAEMDKES